MDADSSAKLAAMIRAGKTAALGTLREGGPFVSMVLFAVEDDFSAFYIHASRLAFHTQDMLADPRVSLMIAETETPGADPQQLARISIRGEAALIAKDSPDYDRIREMYLRKYPASAPLFGFGDFDLYRITPKTARYVAGFARAFNLTPAALAQSARA